MHLRFQRILAALVFAVSVYVPFHARVAAADSTAEQVTAFTNQTVTWTIVDWINWDKLVSWNLTTSTWTIADWWNFGILSGTLEDNDQANQGDQGAIRRVIVRVWGSEASWAFGIVQRESGFNPGATNASSGACGLFQMLGHEDMFAAAGFGGRCHEAVANIEVAHNLYLISGQSPWRL